MKAILVENIGEVVVKDIPDLTEISEYDCLCKNIFASTCTGTDSKLINNTTPWENSYPGVLGHENVAEVIEVGAKVKNFAVGDIVMRPVYVYAGEKRNGYSALFGGFSEYGIVTDVKAMEAAGRSDFNPYARYQAKIPKSWRNNPSAVMLITLKETFSWLNKLPSLYGKDVAIIGSGTVGLFYTKLAAVFCAKSVTVLDINSSRFDQARKVGADNCINLLENDKPKAAFDLLIDAAGILTKIADFIPMVRQDGIFGIYGIDGSLSAHFEGFGSGLTFAFHNSNEADPLVHETCVGLVERGLVELSDFHSAIMPFSQAPEAYELLKARKEFKIVFELGK
jgi:threonine dehydrogenase-like Zn-dependent dehydrogenase